MPTPNPTQPSQLRLLSLGYVLLLLGFLWLSLSAAVIPADVTGAAVRYLSEGLRRTGDVSTEALQARWRITREVHGGVSWVFTPALLMFRGALILVLPRDRHGAESVAYREV